VGDTGRPTERRSTAAGDRGGGKVGRRTVHRRIRTEEVEEHIDEVLPPHSYPAEPSAYPAPVG
jgi:hypothetical protein